jgi:hypothetical protein
MATTIRIEGDQITLNDAASEETLRELVDLLQRQNGGNRGGSASAQGQQKQTADNMKKAADNLKNASVKLGDVVETFDDIEKSAGKSFTEIGAKIGKELGTIAKNTGNVISDLVRGPASFETLGRAMQQGSAHAGELMEEFAQGVGGAIPGIGAIGTGAKAAAGFIGAAGMAAAAYAQNLTDGFVALSQSGANYQGDIMKTQATINGLGLTMNAYTQIVQQNAKSFVSFGGTVARGAKRFTELADVVQGKFGGELYAMGLRYEEQNESLAKYIGMQSRNTAFQNLTYVQQSELYRTYIGDLNRMVALTGKSRQQLQEEMATNQLRADAMVRLKGATEGAQKAMHTVFDIAGQDSAMSQILMAGIAGKDLAFEIAAGNTKIRDMMIMAPEMTERLRKLGELVANGDISHSEFLQELASMTPEIQRVAEDNERLYGAGISAVDTAVEMAASTAPVVTAMENLAKDDGSGAVNDLASNIDNAGTKMADGAGGVALEFEGKMKIVVNNLKEEIQKSISNWYTDQGMDEINIGENIQNFSEAVDDVVKHLGDIAQEFKLFASAPLDYIMGGLETNDLVKKVYEKHGSRNDLAKELNMNRFDLDRALKSMSDDDLKSLIFSDSSMGTSVIQSALGSNASSALDASPHLDEHGAVDVYEPPKYNSLDDLENYLTRHHPNPYALGMEAGQYAQAITRELDVLRSTSPDAVDGYYARLRGLVEGAVGHEVLGEMSREDIEADSNLYLKSQFKGAFNNAVMYTGGNGIPPLPQLQYGGAAGLGMPHIVGERGAELFTPLTAGTITPSNELATAQGNMSILAKLDQLNSTMSLVAGNTGNQAQTEALNNQISTLRELVSQAKRTYRVSRDLRNNSI